MVLVVAVAGAGGSAGAAVDPLSVASGPSPFPPGCNGAPQEGVEYRNAEVEPFVAVNPTDAANLIGVWQQDRYSTGGANGNLTAVSRDGGQSWKHPDPPPFSRCAGGTAANGGDYARASDPWVSFGPDGTAHQIALATSDVNAPAGEFGASAILASSSTDGGDTWGPVQTLIRNDNPALFNDKESITADPTDPNFVYAVWDRLDLRTLVFTGPTFFARSTNGGQSYERARPIFRPGPLSQTIGNQIVVLPNGELVNVFTLVLAGRTFVAAIRSTDKGRSWSRFPTIISPLLAVGVTDPRDGAPVRTGEVLPEVAVDPRPGSNTLYVVWADSRFTGLRSDQIAYAKSTDGGRSWSRPRRVSANAGTQAFTPSVHVDRDGNVGIAYFDFTEDTTRSAPLETDYWFTRSTDGGASFGPRERITSESFDIRTAPNADGFFLGDYMGLDSVGIDFKPLLVLANDANPGNRTDAASTTVGPPFLEDLSAPEGLRQPTGQHPPGLLPGGAQPFIDGAVRPVPDR